MTSTLVYLTYGCDDSSKGGGSDGLPNACGGVGTLDGTPGEHCGDCGHLVCDGTEAVRCEDPGENACGGCETLDGTPGGTCGDCGHLVCDGTDAVRCEDPGLNACGGCGTLDGTPGESCFDDVQGVTACAKWTCDGTESVRCEDPGLNVCGGCSTLDSTPGGACGNCGEGILACSEDGESVECRPAGSTSASAQYLGTWSDRDTDYDWVTVTGTLEQDVDPADWYKARMEDTTWGIVDPKFQLTNPEGASYRLCVYFAREYSGTEVSCDEGTSTTFGDWPGCCTGDTGGTVSLDMGFGGDDDNGFFYMQVQYVSGQPTAECAEYELKFHF